MSTAGALTARRGGPLGAAATVTAVTTWAVGVVLYLVLLSLLLLRLLVVPVRPRQMTTLLVVFGFWRDVLLRDRPDSAPELWTLVFPLGMYSIASTEFGDATGLGFLSGPARAAFWSALLAWTVVLGVMLTSLTRARRVHGPRPHPSIGRSTSGGSSR